MRIIMGGDATPAQIGALLMALRMKGETVEEIAGAAEAMREAATPVRDAAGARSSTPAEREATARGRSTSRPRRRSSPPAVAVTIAKHGNRSVSSRSGSADVLEAARGQDRPRGGATRALPR